MSKINYRKDGPTGLAGETAKSHREPAPFTLFGASLCVGTSSADLTHSAAHSYIEHGYNWSTRA